MSSDTDPQVTEAIELGSKLKDIAGELPIIVGGDFNLTETSLAYKQIITIQGYSDTKYISDETMNMGTFRSWGAENYSNWQTMLPIDHIFIRNSESLKYKVLYEAFQRDTNELTKDISNIGTAGWYDLSDHLGVYAEVVLYE